jgi:hypothetical protein
MGPGQGSFHQRRQHEFRARFERHSQDRCASTGHRGPWNPPGNVVSSLRNGCRWIAQCPKSSDHHEPENYTPQSWPGIHLESRHRPARHLRQSTGPSGLYHPCLGRVVIRHRSGYQTGGPSRRSQHRPILDFNSTGRRDFGRGELLVVKRSLVFGRELNHFQRHGSAIRAAPCRAIARPFCRSVRADPPRGSRSVCGVRRWLCFRERCSCILP